MKPVVESGSDHQSGPLPAMEKVEQDDVGETLNTAQSLPKFWKDLDSPLRPRSIGLYGNIVNASKRSTNDADDAQMTTLGQKEILRPHGSHGRNNRCIHEKRLSPGGARYFPAPGRGARRYSLCSIASCQSCNSQPSPEPDIAIKIRTRAKHTATFRPSEIAWEWRFRDGR